MNKINYRKNLRFSFFAGFFIACTLGVYSFFSVVSCASRSPASIAANPLSTSSSSTQVVAGVSEVDPGLISQARQLTFEGPRAGEGYFSRDGKKMIFQSERFEGNPFYQIYTLDLQSGKTDLISTGKGKTTCAWLHPDGRKALFASSHLDPEFKKKVEEEYALRKAATKGKYALSFDETFDIFSRELKSSKLVRLTTERGYDAEGSYSPDGKLIAFASNRSGYTEKLSAEEQKLFLQDPSYMMDIYIMNADGTKVKQLTTARGYDGGPFFSADGKKITWRRFAPNGQSAEIYSMNIDGSEQTELTHLKAMSWAPYYHPTGDYLIFTSNKLGFSNFELFIVDALGKHEPVRVSYIPDFDGLPVFSPDGQKLSWTHRNEKGESQIYLANWDDQKARALLGLPPKTGLSLSRMSSQINSEDIQQQIKYLASNELKGRRTGSAEEKIYSQEFQSYFAKIGLLPLVKGGGYEHQFSFTSDVALGEKNELVFTVEETKMIARVGESFIPLSMSKTGEFATAGLVFAGYGITAPASATEAAYDSYRNVDAKGKWVLVFRDIPEEISNSKRIHLNMYSRIQHKTLVAKQNGAVGVLIVNGPNSSSRQKLMKLKYEGVSSDMSLPVISIDNELANKLIQPTGRSLKQWQDILDKGEIQMAEVPKTTLQAKVDLNFIRSTGINVLGKIQVKGATETVLIGAHGDHLGLGDVGSSLARADEAGTVHFGADDNASGVAGVLELAHHITALHRTGQIHLNKNLVFAIWSGEEVGILGSTNWLKDQKSEKISAYLNMDMIGRLRDQLMVQGVGSAKEWKRLFEELAISTPLKLSLTEDPYLPTDSMAFYVAGIPTINFFTGAHAEYHTPRDRAELINAEGEVQILELMEKLIFKLAVAQNQPNLFKLSYLKSESSRSQLQGRSFRVYLGTIPDYSQEGIKGVKISGTSKDSPAEKAGLKSGDVIVELAGLKIENLYDYVYGLQSLKANQPAAIKVQRQGQATELSITPMLKE